MGSRQGDTDGRRASSRTGAPSDRLISLGSGLAAIPERLLLHHARGEVLFVTGAGISKSAGLPGFRKLVLDVYEKLDPVVHAVLTGITPDADGNSRAEVSGLTDQQAAEVKRFQRCDYDVVLGMLERRIDGQSTTGSLVRRRLAEVLRLPGVGPAPIHRALMRLADRGKNVSIVTTNFDLLLENSAKNGQRTVQTYSLGGIPRPGHGGGFAGVFHVHGALDCNPDRSSDLVVTDQDFGEFYLRRRVVPDFIYDASRLFNLVFVGYSANDPPMRYLLSAVEADVARFGDLKERFAFVGSFDPHGLQDWRGRGIEPIPYDSGDGHKALTATMARWANLSAINGKQRIVDFEVKRIVHTSRSAASDADRDLFDHLIRRGDSNELVRLSALASRQKAGMGWLDAITAVAREKDRERRA